MGAPDREQFSESGPLTDDFFMREALREAEAAEARGEVPVGCVIVKDGEVIARAHNLREAAQDPTAHAEILALREAASTLGSWRLEGCRLYVTLEPCPMCAGALIQRARAHRRLRLYRPQGRVVHTLYRLLDDDRFNHRVLVVAGVLAEECGNALTSFFRRIRNGQGAPKPDNSSRAGEAWRGDREVEGA